MVSAAHRRECTLKPGPANAPAVVALDVATLLHERDVEQGAVAVDELEQKRLEDQLVLLLAERAVVLPDGQSLRQLAVHEVAHADHHGVDDTGGDGAEDPVLRVLACKRAVWGWRVGRVRK